MSTPASGSRKPKGRTCKRCGTWYRPNKYRSAGAELEFCSVKCKKKAAAEAAVKRETRREW